MSWEDELDEIFELIDSAYAHLSNGERDIQQAYLMKARINTDNLILNYSRRAVINELRRLEGKSKTENNGITFLVDISDISKRIKEFQDEIHT
jgi:hypothetical protein